VSRIDTTPEDVKAIMAITITSGVLVAPIPRTPSSDGVEQRRKHERKR